MVCFAQLQYESITFMNRLKIRNVIKFAHFFFGKQKKKKENVNFQTDHESVIFTKELMKGENKIVRNFKFESR